MLFPFNLIIIWDNFVFVPSFVASDFHIFSTSVCIASCRWSPPYFKSLALVLSLSGALLFCSWNFHLFLCPLICLSATKGVPLIFSRLLNHSFHVCGISVISVMKSFLPLIRQPVLYIFSLCSWFLWRISGCFLYLILFIYLLWLRLRLRNIQEWTGLDIQDFRRKVQNREEFVEDIATFLSGDCSWGRRRSIHWSTHVHKSSP